MENFVSFPKLGIEFKVNRVAFEIFGFEMHWYAIIIAIGMLLALFYCFSVMKKRRVIIAFGGNYYEKNK